MPTYTFEKVEHRVTKTAKCATCGKRLKRSTTLWQTLSPFNKAAGGELKTREQIGVELREEAEKWRGQREWCGPCMAATHLYARDLVASDVVEREASDLGNLVVVSVVIEHGAVGYGDTVRVNAGSVDEVEFRPYDRVVIRPRATE